MNELIDFVKISKYAGERFDLVQAGGGNSSVKLSDGKMYIKSSGVNLADVDKNKGYSVIDNKELLKLFNDKAIYEPDNIREAKALSEQYLSSVNLNNQRPSIETLLHSLLLKYTLHTHPIVVNAITCRSNWKEVLQNLFPKNVLLIEYKTPGIELALALKEEKNLKNKKIIFLQNHGLIVTSNKLEDIRKLTEYVLKTIERYLDVDMRKYKLTNEVSRLFNRNECPEYISYLSEDAYLNNNISNPYISALPFCPDKLVYCGCKVLILKNNPRKKVQDYIRRYFNIPKVVIYKQRLFFVAQTLKKAKEMEDVLKFHLLALNINKCGDVSYLSKEEITFLENWESEKYRQNN